jgi:Ca2+-binding RTX toxin-like protein
MVKYTKEYLDSSIESVSRILNDPEELSSIISHIANGIQNNLSYQEISKKISLKYQIKFLMEDIQNSLIFSADDYEKISNGNFENLSPLAYKNISIIQNSNFYKISYASILSFVNEVAIRGGDLNSQEYLQIAVNSIAQSSANVAVNSMFNGSFAGSNLYYGLKSGAGYGIGHIITVAINDLFADDKMDSHQWKSSFASAGVVGASAVAGSMLASAMMAGSFAGPIGSAVAVVIAYSLLGGKKLNEGEFFEKIDFYQKIFSQQKSDPDFYALTSNDKLDGIIINSSPYYNSNIYGSNLDDSLVGGNGTNTIIGYQGDDQIFGKNDNDILYGNSGFDTIIAGEGDDIVIGGEDNDILYGGGGNDIIYDGNPQLNQQNQDLVNNIFNDSDLIHGGGGNDIIFSILGDDIIFGDSGQDIIKSGTGADIIFGGLGENEIKSGSGEDIIFAGNSGDYLYGEDGNDKIYGGQGDDMIYGGLGDDLIETGAGKNLVFGGGGDDIIYAQFDNKILAIGDYQNSLHAEMGDDIIIGSSYNDLISDGDGDDIIFSGDGNDKIIIGEGNNLIYSNQNFISKIISPSNQILNQQYCNENILYFTNFDSKFSPIFLRENDNLKINFIDQNNNIVINQILIEKQFLNPIDSTNLLIKKLVFNDLIVDISAINSFENSSQNNLFKPLEDQSIIFKKQYFDSIYDQIEISQDLNQINLFGGFNSENSYEKVFNFSAGELANLNSEIFNQVEWQQIKKQRNIFGGHYTVWKKNYNFDLNLSGENSGAIGNIWDEKIYGNVYSNQIYSSAGNDYLWGYDGDDILFGASGSDVINGGLGHDLIIGGQGNDTINGSIGNDEIYGNDGEDLIEDFDGVNIIFAGNSNDIIRISSSQNQIFGEAGNDKIEVVDLEIINQFDLSVYGYQGNLIYGNSGNDSIKSGKKNDFLFGQAGEDFISGNSGSDYISGGEDNDILYGGDDDDKIFGDIGDDIIYGEFGDDFIWGGSGFDTINSGEGNDIIRAGDGDDIIENSSGDDQIFAQNGNDYIKIILGNNYVDGGLGNDQIIGGSGDDKLFGNFGNDLIIDGAGNDLLSGGDGQDLFIIESSKNNNFSHDIIEDFNPLQDKIIIKSNFTNPLNFLEIINNSKNLENDCELSLGNQKLILKNIKLTDLSPQNFVIGYSINENSKIFFAENHSQIIFGNQLDNQIYGSDYNDEIFGDQGFDSLYGMGGDDILRFEIDGKFIKNQQVTYSDEIAYYTSYQTLISKTILPRYEREYYNYKPSTNNILLTNSQSKSVYESGIDLINIQQSTPYLIPISSSKVINEPFRNPDYLWLSKVERIDFLYNQNYSYKTINFYNQFEQNITGYNRSFDNFDGGTGFNSLIMTEGNDFIAFDDNSLVINSPSRIKSIEAIFAGDGDDIVNFTSPNYQAENLIVHGGQGSDKLWLGGGDDQIFGNEGDDEIFGGKGSDNINGGIGKNIIYAQEGNDTINSWAGEDKVFAGAGDDKIYLGEKNLEIYGGTEIDEINLSGFSNDLIIDLSSNLITDLVSNSQIKIYEIENIKGSNYNDKIIGDNNGNIIEPLIGNDYLYGLSGDDIYIISANSGIKTIEESGKDYDKIIINYISPKDLYFKKTNDDLSIYINNIENIIIKNQFINDCKIDELVFDNNSKILFSNNFILADEDTSITINSEYLSKKFSLKNPLNIQNIRCKFGNLIINEFNNSIIYNPFNNFFGQDEIEIIDDSKLNKIQIYINPVNDKPQGQIEDLNIKVNQPFEINLKQYFNDPENDILDFQISIDGFNELPSWFKFDKENSKIYANIQKSGEINLNLKIFDEQKAMLVDNFKLKISRDLKIDANKDIIKNIIEGDKNSNKIYSKEKSNDVLIAGDGDDEIFYLEDELWQNTEELNFKAWNIYSGDIFDVSYKIRNYDCFDGGSGYDKIFLTEKDDAIFLDDQGLSNFGNITKFSDIEEIYAGEGNDIVDLTSLNFSYGDIKIYGQEGDDILWASIGNDTIFGDDGNDNIHGAIGNDILFGNDGNDKIFGYIGDDEIIGGLGSDVIISGTGNDIITFYSLQDSTKNNFDIIEDFDFLNDKISLKNLGFDKITKYQDGNINQDYLSQNAIFYKQENNLTKIFDNNSEFLILMQGNHELTNYNFIFQ